MNEHQHRGRITAGEVSLVCSRYDLGVIDEVRYFRGGSRSSPKVLLITPPPPPAPGAHAPKPQDGRRVAYLLKKRPTGTDPFRVAHSHEVLLYLAGRGFPVPRLVGTRENRNSMVQLDGNIYELFRFIPGLAYDRSEMAARSSGQALAAFHRVMSDFRSTWTSNDTSSPSYHGVTFAKERVAAAGKTLGGKKARLLTDELGERYERAAAKTESVGSKGREIHKQFIHGDWHPGNLVFVPNTRTSSFQVAESVPAGGGGTGMSENALAGLGGRGGAVSGTGGGGMPVGLAVGAVLDFDTVRLGLPIHDLANGALQFSMNRAGPDPEHWPENLNESCFHSFIRGYHEYGLHDAAAPTRRDETPDVRTSEVLPWLMIEALIVEAAAPIAATGKFGKADPLSILGAVSRTTAWIEQHASRLGDTAAATRV